MAGNYQLNHRVITILPPACNVDTGICVLVPFEAARPTPPGPRNDEFHRRGRRTHLLAAALPWGEAGGEDRIEWSESPAGLDPWPEPDS